MAKIFDISGRGPTNRQLMLAGIALITASAVAVVLLVGKSTGRLDSYTRIVADLTNVGDGLPSRSDVRYHGLLVGTVNDVICAFEHVLDQHGVGIVVFEKQYARG